MTPQRQHLDLCDKFLVWLADGLPLTFILLYVIACGVFSIVWVSIDPVGFDNALSYMWGAP